MSDAEAQTLIEDLFSLAGKTAVVVGGGGVLAGEMSMGLAGAGANIVIADLNEDAARRQAQAVRGLGCRRDQLAPQRGVALAVRAHLKDAQPFRR